MPTSSADEPLLSTSFCTADRRFLFSRLRLFPDRITLWGVHWTGLYRRTIALGDVARAQWWTGARHGEINFSLALHGTDEQVSLWVKKAGALKYEVDAHASRLAPDADALAPASVRSAA